jgi:hypothetical protein
MRKFALSIASNPDLDQHDGLLVPLGVEFVKTHEHLDRRSGLCDGQPHGVVASMILRIIVDSSLILNTESGEIAYIVVVGDGG